MPSISRIQKSGDRPRTSRVYAVVQHDASRSGRRARLLTPTMRLPNWTTSGSPTRPEPLHPVHRHDVRAVGGSSRGVAVAMRQIRKRTRVGAGYRSSRRVTLRPEPTERSCRPRGAATVAGARQFTHAYSAGALLAVGAPASRDGG